MKRKPKISIAIPTFNEERNIDRCLSSVFGQEYGGELEVFIVDGGSTDRTIQLARKYPVTVLKNPYKQAEYGKKIAFDKSTGAYFMILDCDMDVVGPYWFDRMVDPLEANPDIAATFTQFVYRKEDAALNRYITFDPIQRDPLFVWLTPGVGQCLVRKATTYWEVEYRPGHIVPAGFCLYRKSELLKTPIASMKKFMELDNLVIYTENGWTKFAYVPDIGLHHPFLTTLSNLVRKRVRNLDTMYFNQPDRRYWTWIDWGKPWDLVKIALWMAYTYTIIPSILVGLYKTFRHLDLAGMYELPFNILTTNAIVSTFLRQKEGRGMLGRVTGLR